MSKNRKPADIFMHSKLKDQLFFCYFFLPVPNIIKIFKLKYERNHRNKNCFHLTMFIKDEVVIINSRKKLLVVCFCSELIGLL